MTTGAMITMTIVARLITMLATVTQNMMRVVMIDAHAGDDNDDAKIGP